MGVPDMIRAALPDLPPVIDITIDVSKTDRQLKKDIIKVGKMFTNDAKKIRQALEYAQQEQRFSRKIAQSGYTLNEAISIWEHNACIPLPQDQPLRIGLLGHGYSLYDPIISMNIVKRLRSLGCEVILPESLDRGLIEQAAATLPKRIFWTLGRKMVGSALHMDQLSDIDGLIYVACFGCGPDSMIGEIIERKVHDTPFMLITVDEHTGEAGLITRLEAFCDMLLRRRNSAVESNISAHG